jgi:hypothetical protein
MRRPRANVSRSPRADPSRGINVPSTPPSLPASESSDRGTLRGIRLDSPSDAPRAVLGLALDSRYRGGGDPSPGAIWHPTFKARQMTSPGTEAHELGSATGGPSPQSVAIGPNEKRPAACTGHDPRASRVAERVGRLIVSRLPGVVVEHIGSTAVAGCAGKGVIDLMVLYKPGRLAEVTEGLDALGFQRQTGRDPFPEERPMPSGSVGRARGRCREEGAPAWGRAGVEGRGESREPLARRRILVR